MDTVLIVGPENLLKNQLAQRLATRLCWRLSLDSLNVPQTEEPTVVTCNLVQQFSGAFTILPERLLSNHRNPLLVILVLGNRESSPYSSQVAAHLAEEAAALSLCASSAIPLRILTFEEATNPVIVDQLIQVVSTLRKPYPAEVLAVA